MTTNTLIDLQEADSLNQMDTLRHWVSVDAGYQRSMRLDRDASNAGVLAGYVAQTTCLNALQTMATHINSSRQRSFTWTGPYGCGKSSLALVLSSLLGKGARRDEAARILSLADEEAVSRAFASREGWKQILMVGRQASLTDDLAERLKVKNDGRAVVQALEKAAEAESEGFILMIDELGKYLEAENASENAYLLQEIAEAANRSSAKFVFLGILHQAVDVYASKLPRTVRDEWAKVQGRFIDIPLLSSSEETIELLGHAFAHPHGTPPMSPAFLASVDLVAKAFAKRRPEMVGRIQELLIACWPLNPVTTLLLGPISRRKFSQNERSIYSFLSASEPKGFRLFVEGSSTGLTYDPADYWDYLKENFENAILTTNESHRWLTAVESVMRAERTCGEGAVRLAKAVAIIDLFRTGSGIEASREVLAAAVNMTVSEVEPLLVELCERKVIIERRYAGAFAIFAGSDFDLEAALTAALEDMGGIDTSTIARYIEQTPIVAREHYLRMGTMRWFNRKILLVSELLKFIGEKHKPDGSVGTFILLLPDHEEDVLDEERLRTLYAQAGLSHSDERNFVLGFATNGARIRMLLEEVQALAVVSRDPMLEGDETGRAEGRMREEFVSSMHMDELAVASASGVWYAGLPCATTVRNSRDLVNLATSLCDMVFSEAPVINNESLNRDYISSQITMARRELMNRMVTNRTEEGLGFEGFPPAYAFYLSLLKKMHKRTAKGFDFVIDHSDDPDEGYDPLWSATEKFLKSRPMATAKEIAAYWAKPPFGIKSGPMPVLLLAFYLACRNNLAVYLGGAFQPSFTVATVDEWLVDPGRIAFRWVEMDQGHEEFIKALATRLEALANEKIEHTPLDVARAVVAVVLKAPQWALRSTSYTPDTLKLKTTVQKASDPIQLLFQDIPQIYRASINASLASRVTESLMEFIEAMPGMIGRVRGVLLNALQADPADLESLHARARSIKGLSGDMSFEGFVARLENFSDKQAEIEGIISLATNRPSRMWTDREIEAALTRISELGFKFRQLEAQATLRGRSSSRRVFAVTMAGAGQDVVETVEVSNEDLSAVSEKARLVEVLLKELPRELAVAALSEAGLNLIRK